ncbi:MAG: hypothetical protein PHD74_02665 [Candidatus Krumholzibacteria bacterium]|nr:hypothetical protein [Candidatus Krumholzibacteria bacterium]
MKKLVLVLLMAGLVLSAGRSFAGDTGTYRILSYRVGLTPHSDGTVAVDYYQKWLVTGGHIPWITVGTPNESFEIVSHRGAISVISSASQSGWSGVRLDLDQDYQRGQTFEVSFSTVQKGLFYAEKDNYELEFTPGWYDRAAIDTMRVSVKFFASLATVTADPKPSSVSGDEMIWDNYSLGPGGRLTIHVSFPVALFPTKMAASNLKSASGGAGGAVSAIVAFVIILTVLIIVIMALRLDRGRYSGGNIFYGGMLGGGSRGGRSGGGRSAGGGGGFGGASMSCACACVSCACACACAGGGGAGCSRKLEHTCPVCVTRRG